MTRIALLTPTRGRPDQCRRMIESAKATSSSKISVHLYVTFDDPLKDDYKDIGYSSITYGPDYPTVHKWNELAEHYCGDDVSLFMLAADDMVFATPGWDTALIEHYEALKEKCHVYHLLDSRDASGFPHPIISREYIDAMGYFIPPIFLHWFADTWTCAIARGNGCFTQLSDYSLIHDKPSDRGQPDETHNRIRRNGWHDRDAYVAKTCDHFLKAEMLRLDNYLRKREAA